MSGALEIVANALNAASIVLAGRNSIHTWWTGIAGCILFGWVFFAARLYADVTLQGFFVITSAIGLLRWWRRGSQPARPVTHTSAVQLTAFAACAVATSYSYGSLLAHYTDAAAPLADSVVLCFSVLGQLLLVARRLESWWCWILVNIVAVPLYASRGLYLTAALYLLFWVNAWVSLLHWRRLAAQVYALAATSMP